MIGSFKSWTFFLFGSLCLSFLLCRLPCEVNECQRNSEASPTIQPQSTATHTPAKLRHAKEPPVFHGEASDFKEWIVSVKLAVKALGINGPAQMQDYASGFLGSNARLWLIASQEADASLSAWQALREALRQVYEPVWHEQRYLQTTRPGDCSLLMVFSQPSTECCKNILPSSVSHSDRHRLLTSFCAQYTYTTLVCRNEHLPLEFQQSGGAQLGRLIADKRQCLSRRGGYYACRNQSPSYFHALQSCTVEAPCIHADSMLCLVRF
eukprot:scpid61166/ scgid15944/ 